MDIVPSLVLLQKQYLRYIAVGVMIAGSLWSLIAILPTIKRAINLGIAGSTRIKLAGRLRTEKDIPTFIFITGIFLISFLLVYSFIIHLIVLVLVAGIKLPFLVLQLLQLLLWVLLCPLLHRNLLEF